MKFSVVDKETQNHLGSVEVDEGSGKISFTGDSPKLDQAKARMANGIIVETSKQMSPGHWVSYDVVAEPQSPFFFVDLRIRLRRYGLDIPETEWPTRPDVKEPTAS